jgi:hypothetical protein
MKKAILFLVFFAIYKTLFAGQTASVDLTLTAYTTIDMQSAAHSSPNFAWISLVICLLLLGIRHFFSLRSTVSNNYAHSV